MVMGVTSAFGLVEGLFSVICFTSAIAFLAPNFGSNTYTGNLAPQLPN